MLGAIQRRIQAGGIQPAQPAAPMAPHAPVIHTQAPPQAPSAPVAPQQPPAMVGAPRPMATPHANVVNQFRRAY